MSDLIVEWITPERAAGTYLAGAIAVFLLAAVVQGLLPGRTRKDEDEVLNLSALLGTLWPMLLAAAAVFGPILLAVSMPRWLYLGAVWLRERLSRGMKGWSRRWTGGDSKRLKKKTVMEKTS